MQSHQFPRPEKPFTPIPKRYRRIKVWKVQSNIGEFCIYAVNAEAVRTEFKRLRPSATIINITRNS